MAKQEEEKSQFIWIASVHRDECETNGWRKEEEKKCQPNANAAVACTRTFSISFNCRLKFKKESLSWWISLLLSCLFAIPLSITGSIFYTRMTYRIKMCASHTQKLFHTRFLLTFSIFNVLRLNKFGAVIEW